jgi:queuosine precursor transporter
MTHFLSNIFKFIKRCPWTLGYICTIPIINSLFVIFPPVRMLGVLIMPGDIVVGSVYVMRDFSQREIKHYVILAMLIGSILSYWLADPTVAFASVSAFLAGEFIDWAIFTFTGKPLSQRLLWSSAISAPIDSAVFLHFMNLLDWADFNMMNLSKMLGILAVWYLWRMKQTPATLQETSSSKSPAVL